MYICVERWIGVKEGSEGGKQDLSRTSLTLIICQTYDTGRPKLPA